MQLINDFNKADFFYCECCGQFYDRQTLRVLDIPYSEMEAEFALEVMTTRQKSAHGKQRRRTGTGRAKGFGGVRGVEP